MRTLKGQGLNHIALQTEIGDAALTESFKNETAEFANDGTQLVEKNGLADIYYAALVILAKAGITPDEKSENSSGIKTRPSQILTALQKLFADSYSTDAALTGLADLIASNFGGNAYNSNSSLRASINSLSNTVTSNFHGNNNASNTTLNSRLSQTENGLANVENNAGGIKRVCYKKTFSAYTAEFPLVIVSNEELNSIGATSDSIISISGLYKRGGGSQSGSTTYTSNLKAMFTEIRSTSSETKRSITVEKDDVASSSGTYNITVVIDIKE